MESYHATAISGSSSIFGLWKIDEKHNAQGKTQIYFKIEAGRITLRNEYEIKGFSTFAEATAPVLLTKDCIKVLENRSVTERVDAPRETLTFRLNLRKSTMRYRVDGERLILEADDARWELPRAIEA